MVGGGGGIHGASGGTQDTVVLCQKLLPNYLGTYLGTYYLGNTKYLTYLFSGSYIIRKLSHRLNSPGPLMDL